MRSVKEPVRRGGRPKAMDDETRRGEIVRAAYDAFILKGFADTTTADIAARAKTSKRVLYEMFANKMDLFAAVIQERQHLILDLPRPAEEQLPIAETLFRIFRLDIDDKAAQAREAILNLVNREAILFPELTDYLYETEVIRSRQALVEWLQTEMSNGRLPAGDVLVYAGMLMDIVFGALQPRRRTKNASDRALNTVHIKQRLGIFLRGI